MSEKKNQTNGQEPEDNQPTETEAQSVEAADASSNADTSSGEETAGGLPEDNENEPDDVLIDDENEPNKQPESEQADTREDLLNTDVSALVTDVESLFEAVRSQGEQIKEARQCLDDVEKRSGAFGKRVEAIETVNAKQSGEIKNLKLKLSDERIIAIARGLEKFLFRCEDTNSAMQATLDSQPIWWQKEIWRFLAITTMIAWLMVGVALSVPDLRIEIGRSLISQREQMMIEVAEEAWRQDEARREAEEAGRGER